MGRQDLRSELSAQPHDRVDVITAYVARGRELFLAHELARSQSLMRPENAHAGSFPTLEKTIGERMTNHVFSAGCAVVAT